MPKLKSAQSWPEPPVCLSLKAAAVVPVCSIMTPSLVEAVTKCPFKVGAIVPTPTLPLPRIVIFSVAVLSVVAVAPAVAVKKRIAEEPVPVAIPDLNVKSPPAKFAVPAIAPPELIVNPCPPVAAVVFLSMAIIRAVWPPRDRRFEGAVVPIPTLPELSSIMVSTVSAALSAATTPILNLL